MNAARDRHDHVDVIEREGRLFTAAIRAAGATAQVPTCPGWTIRDLVLHQGEVHRWATIVVRDALAKPSAVPADHLGALPADGDLVPWFNDGVADLVATLTAAPDNLEAFRFLADPPSPATFWARRQAHETEIHRVDAESALAMRTPIEIDTAIDGIDELLTGFVPRAHMRLRTETPQTLAIAITDGPAVWHLTISDAPAVTTRQDAPADCTVRGPAEEVYLALWNRCGTNALSIEGDASLLDRFRDQVTISWS